MPTHVHLLIYPTSNNYNMAKILQGIKQSVSRRVMARARKSDPTKLAQFSTGDKSKPYRFWQIGGGYDRNIVSRIALMKAIDYIHNNPVRAGLVKSAQEWKWSSFRDWENLGCGPIGLDIDDIPLT
jgi:putative transposase